jgi:hypothetical protein
VPVEEGEMALDGEQCLEKAKAVEESAVGWVDGKGGGFFPVIPNPDRDG